MKYRELFDEGVRRLEAAGKDSPGNEMKELMSCISGFDRLHLSGHSDDVIPPEQETELKELIRRRADGEPLQYLIGSWTFMDCELRVGPGVLIPRDDTEVCVRECIRRLEESGNEAPYIVDLCSGSGAIAIALAKHFPKAQIFAIELSDEAFSYLEKNIELNSAGQSVEAILADIFRAADGFAQGSIDAIISNPPYILSDELKQLQREVQHEPAMALDGGGDGLDFYRVISQKWLSKLRPGGIISLEIGEDQASAVCGLLHREGIAETEVFQDLGSLDRCVCGTVSRHPASE